MQLLSVYLARSTWILPFTDLNPRGKNLFPVMAWLIESYKFKQFPSVNDKFDYTSGIKFENGEYETRGGEKIALNLTVYSGGLTADTRSSTQDSDAFLEDMLTNISELFKMPPFKSVLKRIAYYSQLYVSTDKPLELINPKLKEIAEFLSAHTLGYKSPSYELGGLSFWPDQTQSINPPNFSFERTAGVPFSENRYYSGAPLTTDKHLELLEKLESILAG